MDVLNIAVFIVALCMGLAQHLLDRGGHVAMPDAGKRWWTNGVLYTADVASLTLYAAAISWLTRPGAAQGALGIGAQSITQQIAVLLVVQSLMSYWLHRWGHSLPAFWRLHRVHHADTTLDATTGLRTHPLEGVVVYTPILILTLFLTPSAEAVLGTFVISFGFNMFTHIDPGWVPARLDRALSHVIMTPRLHQLHHSTWQPETDTNFGNILVIWDKMFGTFLPAPHTPRAGFAVGLNEFPVQAAQDPFLQLASPFLAADQRKDGSPAA